MTRTATRRQSRVAAATAGNIRIGTASWQDRSLLEAKLFYPPDVNTPEERLRYYASHFSFVEVDSTYYTVEMVENARRWAERTPDGFVFDIKAFRLLTGHQTPPSMLPADVRDILGPLPEGKRNWYYKDVPADARNALWEHMHASLAPLRDARRLGAVVFQLPPWTMPTPEAREHLEECADRLGDVKMAVEFRNKYWLSERNRRRTLAFLRESGLAMVVVDEPQGFRSSVPQVWEVTDPELAVVRLHGRNTERWEAKGLRMASERFDYVYNRDELRSFVEPVGGLASKARDVHVTFNNNLKDYAQRNAQEFAELLAEA